MSNNGAHAGLGAERDERVFALGVGAQRAGTTWLWSYLNHFDCTDFCGVKEYHVWDILTLPDIFDSNRPVEPGGSRIHIGEHILTKLRNALGKRPGKKYLRKLFCSETASYFEHFESILDKPGIRITGDITPSYSGLGRETLERIRDEFKSRGISVKAVFLMRDPIERARSAIRLYHRERFSGTRHGVNMSLDEESALLSYLASPQGRHRGDFHKTISRLEAVFAPQDIYLGFYEKMFEDHEFERLNLFFGLQPNPNFISHKFNMTAPARPISDSGLAQALELTKNVYDECLSRWPDLANVWHEIARADFPPSVQRL